MLGERADDMTKEAVSSIDERSSKSGVYRSDYQFLVICLEMILLTLVRFFLPSFLEVLSVCFRMRTVKESTQL